MIADRALVLDVDNSIGALPGERRVALQGWQERVRFGCSAGTLQSMFNEVPEAAGATVFMGSGDFHHLSWPLIQRAVRQRPMRVLVLDNHPDNMRFPFGVHCGSWVRRVAALPNVSHVHVAGITSGDIGWRHSWENDLRPMWAGKLTYWSIGQGSSVGWGSALGLASVFRDFADADTMVDALLEHLRTEDGETYLSIDKDAFAPDVVQTNWDQGVLREQHAHALIDALRPVASDVTGEVSSHTYSTWWKRLLSSADGQDAPDAALLAQWQAAQAQFNARLLDRLHGRA